MESKQLIANFNSVLDRIDKLYGTISSLNRNYEQMKESNEVGLKAASNALFLVAPLDIDLKTDTECKWYSHFTLRSGLMGHRGRYDHNSRNILKREALKSVLTHPDMIEQLRAHKKPRVTNADFNKFIAVLKEIEADWDSPFKSELSTEAFEKPFKWDFEDKATERISFVWNELKFYPEERYPMELNKRSSNQYLFLGVIDQHYDFIMNFLQETEDYYNKRFEEYKANYDVVYQFLNRYKLTAEV